MSDLRAALDAELGELPPSTVDLRSVVAAQRRRARLRVAGAGVATAAVLLAGVTLAGSVVGDGPSVAGPPTGVASPTGAVSPTCAPRSASPTPPPSPWITGPVTPTGSTEPDPDLPVGAEGRLTAALTAAVRAEIRADRLGPVTVDDVERAPLRFFGGPCDPDFRDSYVAVASVRADGAGPAGKLTVLVQASPESGCRPDGDDIGCATERRPDGTVIRSKVVGTLLVEVLVAVTKPDGTTVQLVSTADPGEARRPVVDVATLTRIGLAPGLTLTG